MARNPKFIAALDKMGAIHDAKNQDYADDTNPYSNFEGAARMAGITVEQQFMSLIGVKIERLRQLLSGKTVNFEPLEDTMLDLAVYATLLYSYSIEEEPEEDPGKCKHGYRPTNSCLAVEESP